MANSTVLAILNIDKYNNWMVQEYNGKYSVVDCYKTSSGEWRTSFCEIKKRDGDMIKIPKGLGGQFESKEDLRAALFQLIKSVDEYEGEAVIPPEDDDIPFA